MSRKVGVMIQHPEVWDEFREYVVKKWGKKHTAMALELEQAIIEYLSKRRGEAAESPRGGRRVHTRGQRSGQRSGKIMGEVPMLKAEVLRHVGVGGKIRREDLRKIICQATGIVNRRSIDDRIEALVSVGFLEEASGNVFRVVGDVSMEYAREVARRIVGEGREIVTQLTVEKHIRQVSGGDLRTVAKYLEILVNYGVLKPGGCLKLEGPSKGEEQIFKVDFDEAKRFAGIS